MFKLYKTGILRIIRNPINICWAILFPCLLITLFTATMGNLDKTIQLAEPIKLIMVSEQDSEVTKQMKEVFQSEDVGKNIQLSIYTSEEEARQELENQKTDAYFTIHQEDEKYNIDLICSNNSFAVSMLKGIFESYSNTVNSNYKLFIQNNGQINPVENKDFIEADSSLAIDKVPSFIARYTYPAIIFSILQIGILITEFIYSLSPGLSYEGARIDVSPQKKWKLLVSSVLAIFTVGMIAVIIVTLYASLILKIQIGFIENILEFLLLYGVGMFSCISLGAMLTMLCSSKVNLIPSICTWVVMVLYFVAGGMIDSLPALIKTYVPIVHYINPASTLSDAILKLSFHQDMKFFWLDLVCAFGMGVIFILVAIWKLRRDKNELY